jgi:Na+-transporting NADH:ubiquinone oxidoreductase subunit C
MDYSKSYTIGFTALVCLFCSIIVAGSYVSLKDLQDANVVLDRQKKVLIVAGLMSEGESLDPADIVELFANRIVPRAVDLSTGEFSNAVDPDTYDQRKAAKDPEMSHDVESNPAKVRRVPNYGLIFEVQSETGKTNALIIPIEGKGLWSTLYGYLALSPDTRTIQGITFYEHGETPGLGGEVDNPHWKGLWKGRMAFDERWVPRIRVVKGQAGPVETDPYQVDGLSGATITSRGVSSLVGYWLGDSGFGPYLAKVRARNG